MREWSTLVVRHPWVLWHELHAAGNRGSWGSLWQLAHEVNRRPLYVVLSRWHATQPTVVCAPVSGNAVRRWSNVRRLSVNFTVVAWQLAHRLPSAPLKVSGKGLDWQWVVGSNTTDASCPEARQLPFVAGFAPPYAACVIEQPPIEGEEQEGGGWRSCFGVDRKEEPAPPPEPAPQQR